LCAAARAELPLDIVNKQTSYRASLYWQEIIMTTSSDILPKESCPVAALA